MSTPVAVVGADDIINITTSAAVSVPVTTTPATTITITPPTAPVIDIAVPPTGPQQPTTTLYPPAMTAHAAMAAPTITITTAGPVSYTDDFNRANAPSLGPNWTPRCNALAISGDAAQPTAGGWNIESWTTPMPTDDMQVTLTVGTTPGQPATNFAALLGASNNPGDAAWLFLTNYDLELWHIGDWNVGTYTQVNPFAPLTPNPGDTISLKRVGNVYTAYYNGSPIGTPYTDTTGVFTIDANHRYVAVGVYASPGTTIDAWSATQI